MFFSRPYACVALAALAGFACVHVPRSIKHEFREVEPGERSNFRPGAHGRAAAVDVDDPWTRHARTAEHDAGIESDAGLEDAAVAEPDAALAERRSEEVER